MSLTDAQQFWEFGNTVTEGQRRSTGPGHRRQEWKSGMRKHPLLRDEFLKPEWSKKANE